MVGNFPSAIIAQQKGMHVENYYQASSQAQNAPTPATIFSLFYKGKFVTTDLSACMEQRFDKALGL